MVTVSVNEARKHLAELIDTAAVGREVVIARRGKPVVRLSAIEPRKRPPLPDLAEFRRSLGKTPRQPIATISRLRKQQRY